jgi:hypothetical protein
MLGSVMSLNACHVEPPDTSDASGPTFVYGSTPPTEPTGTQTGPWLTANVTPERGDPYVFSPTAPFQGGWSEAAWGFEAIDNPPRILTFAIAGPVLVAVNELGPQASGTFGLFADAVAYAPAHALFYTTSGTLTVTRLEANGPAGTETYTVDGTFDGQVSNDDATVLHLVGSFGNVILPPYATR